MTEIPHVVRVRLDVSYDGTDFAGWAKQPGLRTVEGVLEEGLARVVRGDSSVRLTVAGRTDAGVHARGQVAHADVPAAGFARLPGRSPRSEIESLRVRLRGVLPPDLIVTDASIAPPGFDARYSATERRYAYRVDDDPDSRDPLTRRHVHWHTRPVDLDALNVASASLTGLRDFAGFCRPRPRATTIRELAEFSWRRETEGSDAGLVVATLRADAFCHTMVRSLVGAVLAVGDGKRDPEWLARLAAADRRTAGVVVAPACGLTLEAVSYPADAEMAARASETRERRTLN